jgi:hypothetical protein
MWTLLVNVQGQDRLVRDNLMLLEYLAGTCKNRGNTLRTKYLFFHPGLHPPSAQTSHADESLRVLQKNVVLNIHPFSTALPARSATVCYTPLLYSVPV